MRTYLGASFLLPVNLCNLFSINEHSFIFPAFHLKRGPQPLPKRVLQTVQVSVSSFNFQYPLFSLESSNSCLPILPRLPFAYILPTIFQSLVLEGSCYERCYQSSYPSSLLLCVGYSSKIILFNIISHVIPKRSRPKISQPCSKTGMKMRWKFPLSLVAFTAEFAPTCTKSNT